MTALSLHGLHAADHLASPREPGGFGLHAPARGLFADFHFQEPHIIDGWMRAIDAGRHMRQTHDAAVLVVDREDVVGAILRDDLSEAQLMRRVANGERRDEIRVCDLMTHRHELRALSIEALKEATVGDVIEALRNHGKRFCLIVDPTTHEIRGLIAASIVARRLSVTVDLGCASTFADVFAAIHPS
jgi:CBS domain-containing protein